MALAVAVLFGGGAYYGRALTRGGAGAAGVLAFTLLAVGGWRWGVPGAGFFVLSSVLSRLGPGRAARLEKVSEKGSRRDAAQVAANGGVAGLCLVGQALWPGPAWLWAFLGSFAAANADTWATEIGTLAGGTPRLVPSLRRVPPGTSGAVSGAGTLAALAGAFTIWALAAAVFPHFRHPAAAAIVGASGFAGAWMDTLLGATVQAQYHDAQGGLTERAHADGRPNRLARGLPRVTNDAVNAACTAAGALAALALARAAGYF